MALSLSWKAGIAIVGLSILPSIVSARPAPQNADPACSGWHSIGCYLDNNSASHTLGVSVVPSTTEDTTIDNCQAACLARGYIYSGAEWGFECWCDNGIQNGAQPVADSYCNQPCFGNMNETCGGYLALSVFNYGCPSSSSSSSASSTSSTSSMSSSSTVDTTSTSSTSAT